MKWLVMIWILCGWMLPQKVRAHVGPHPSVHDTTAGIVERLRKVPGVEKFKKASEVEGYLTSHEKAVLGSEHIRFEVDRPVVVSVVLPAPPAEELFWLRDPAYQRSAAIWMEGTNQATIYERRFEKGSVGLGVNSLIGGGNHYVVLVRGEETGEKPSVQNLYPGQLRVTTLTNGVKVYVDNDATVTNVPPALAGSVLIQTRHGARDDGKLLNLFRLTPHLSTRTPDQVILTWSDDPQTTQTIQWRTSTAIRKGAVRYRAKADVSTLRNSRGRVGKVKAITTVIETPNNLNDPVMHHHTAVVKGLKPGTTYIYSVGDGRDWSEESEFTTAPGRTVPFSLIYMGDAQNGLDRWGSMLKGAFRSRPDVAFYIMAGDLVNRGADRDDWDSLFYNAKGIYDRRQLVPVLGNHECQGGHPSLYLKLFKLPANGPEKIEPGRAYSFEYSNALFVVLDSNLSAASQTNWLERVLGQSKATWKIVTYHHPAYSSAPDRDNKDVRELWTEIFDRHHVDMALQGHDHAYLRTYPMKGQKPVEKTKDGTVYVVSVSGQKFYEQAKREYTAFGMTNVATYQVLDLEIDGDRLVYRAYDDLGELRDQLIIDKAEK